MITKFDTNKIIFLLCNCTSEVLTLNYYEKEQLAELSIYSYYNSHINKLSLTKKLKIIWDLLWNNKTYEDQMVLDKSNLRDLKDFIQDIL
jgi:hypothetical protein